ncbi:hypothetical protein C8R45DRAFT_1079702 [Mycena sanguinolenta]|nr:hypothetical protein C8R45DRAFT_1079702 [Mycena sanguinolenta]
MGEKKREGEGSEGRGRRWRSEDVGVKLVARVGGRAGGRLVSSRQRPKQAAKKAFGLRRPAYQTKESTSPIISYILRIGRPQQIRMKAKQKLHRMWAGDLARESGAGRGISLTIASSQEHSISSAKILDAGGLWGEPTVDSIEIEYWKGTQSDKAILDGVGPRNVPLVSSLAVEPTGWKDHRLLRQELGRGCSKKFTKPNPSDASRKLHRQLTRYEKKGDASTGWKEAKSRDFEALNKVERGRLVEVIGHKAMLDALQDPTSPVLPSEITSEIFIHCLPTSIWREIAIGTPALWAKMELSLHNAHSHAMAQAWLRRAQGRSIFVKLHRWAFEDDSEAEVWAISTLQTLLERADTLKFLELSAIPVKYIRELDKLSSSCTFPSLQRLTIGGEEDEIDGWTEWERESMKAMPCVQLFTNAPLLDEVSLIGIPPLFLRCLPWHQLTKFTGTNVRHYDCIDVLRLGSNLVECAFATGGISTDFVEILIHPSLKSLTLFKDKWCSTDIFQFITLPALETVRILCEDERLVQQEFVQFLTRSSPPLRQFTIRLDCDTLIVASVFRSMASHVQLEIWNAHEMFLAVFFSCFDDDTVLPQLQHISFFNPYFNPYHSSKGAASRQLEKVQGGLTARWNARHHGIGQLKSFGLVWDWDVGGLPEDVLVPLRALTSEELSISLKSPTRSYI